MIDPVTVGTRRPSTDYVGVLRRYWATVTALSLLVVGIALAVIFVAGPSYQATAEILVVANTMAAVDATSSSPPSDPVRALGAEMQLLTGPIVRGEVRSRLGRTRPISVSADANADIIRIKASSDDPARAASVANAYATAYLDVRMATANAAATAASRPIQSQITDLQAQIDRATGPRRAGLIKTQAAFESELSRLQVGVAVHNAQTRLLAAASPPASPSHPRPMRTVAWALGIGLALGCAAAFYRDYLDDSIKSYQELGAAWPDLSIWGSIAPVTDVGGRPEPRQVFEPRSRAGEGYQSLANVIRSRHLDSGGQVLQITSPTGGEGKSTTVANLGVILAEQGRRVAIVGCDLRRPRVQDYFGLSNDIGLTSVITRKVALRDAVFRVENQPTLVAIPAGPVPPNPAELLASDRAAQIVESLKDQVDVVLVDCPPVRGVTDSVIVSRYADATLLVCRAGASTHHDLAQAIDRLRLGGVSVAGIVLVGETPIDAQITRRPRGRPESSRDTDEASRLVEPRRSQRRSAAKDVEVFEGPFAADVYPGPPTTAPGSSRTNTRTGPRPRPR